MRPSHIVVLLIVLIIIFGASKLPDIARNVGKSAKILKQEMRELQEEPSPSTQAAPTSGLTTPNSVPEPSAPDIPPVGGTSADGQ